MNKAIEEFKKYTSAYIEYGTMITLKINHTLRVVELCEKIAKSLNMSDEEIYIAKIIGLLHDIGRFEQWKVYGTFKDIDSTDHADLGVKILKKDNYLRKYIEDDKYDKLILDSIMYHNKFFIPNNLDEKTNIFSKLIRDADKIDILYLYIDREIDLELDEKCFSKEVYEALLNKKDIDRKNIKNKTDRFSVSLGFIFDINYKYSFKYLKENKYFDTIIDIYKNKLNSEEFNKQLEEIRKVINNYIEVNLC
ncbi:MAG: HD domain-containing protein [Bacilli bacterium]|nr:HD domain-containing protein [Bacilli bacterium]